MTNQLLCGKSTGGEYKNTIMKHKSEKAVRSAAQETFLLAIPPPTQQHMEDNDYKESLKVKRSPKFFSWMVNDAFWRTKAAEEEAQRRQRRVEEQEAAQKEMSKRCEAEKRQAEKQRLLSESQLQTEILQRKLWRQQSGPMT